MSAKPYGKFAEVYDRIMNKRFYELYFNFIIDCLRNFKAKPRKVLDLACGTGKLGEIFFRKGYDVEGLDISPDMLKIAGKRGIKTHQGDIAKFRLGKKYELILCSFDSLNYLTTEKQLQNCFASVKNHLADDGLFIFDLNSNFKINSAIPKKFDKTAYFKIGGKELIWLNSHRPNTWVVEIIIFEKSKNSKYKYERFYEKHVEKAYYLGEVSESLKKTGFEILGAYSDFDFSKVKRNSLKWFFVCRMVSHQQFFCF